MTNRLFVPLAKDPFRWFMSGAKTLELRQYGRNWTEKTIWIGRRVELRLGYSGSESLWGTIKNVKMTTSVFHFFEYVPYSQVIPTAKDEIDAFLELSKIVKRTNSLIPVIGFHINLDNADQARKP